MEHGGDLISYKDYYDGELIDFSSNINPLGPPKNLKEKIVKNFDRVESYPDIEYRMLRESIARYLGCRKENILVGNGAMEIIDLFNINFKRLITTTPAFSEYKIRARIHGKPVIELAYGKNFNVDLKKIKSVVKKDDLLLIGNPNNPTGLRIEENRLIEIYNHVNKVGGYLLLDEAFFEFAPKDYDSVEIFGKNDFKNVGIIRAATKFFAIPGLRLGYGCVSKSMAKKIRDNKLSWSINCFADIAGQVIFNDKDYIESSKRYIDKERDYLTKKLKYIDRIKIYNTQTNYILIELLDKNEDELFEKLLTYGIVVRKCSSFESLGDNHIRVAIKSRKENKKLIQAMYKILG